MMYDFWPDIEDAQEWRHLEDERAAIMIDAGAPESVARKKAKHLVMVAFQQREKGMPATCRSCGAAVVWVTMESGKRMPVDANSIDKRVVLSGDRKRGAVRDVGVSHFQTCPNAGEHRRGEG